MGIKDISVGRSDTYRVKLTDLHIKEGWNSRVSDDPTNLEHIDTLAQSIAAIGIERPLKVKFHSEEDKIYITDGHCRYQAAHLAIEKYGADPEMTVPVAAAKRDSTDADDVFDQIIMNSGKPLTPIEQATVISKLIELEVPKSLIATRTGFSSVYIANLLELATAPKALTALIQAGKVSSTLAISTIKANKGDMKAATEALKGAVANAEKLGKARATAKHVETSEPVAPKDEAEPKRGLRNLATIAFADLFEEIDWEHTQANPDDATNISATIANEILLEIGGILNLLPRPAGKNEDII